MVNASLNWASIVGIVLAVGGAFLYFMRNFKPALARDYDVFFAAIGLLCGGILFFQGWRLDPILQFGQFLLAGTTVFFAYESVRLRGVTTEQARRSSYFDDEEPGPSFQPRGGLGGGRDWDNDRDRFDEPELPRRRIPSREEGPEEDFYRPRRPSRAAIPERAASRRGEPAPWDQTSRSPVPERQDRDGPGPYGREPESSSSSRYASSPRSAPAQDFGSRRANREGGPEPRRGSRPVASADTMPRSNRRPGGPGTSATEGRTEGRSEGRPVGAGATSPLPPTGVPQGAPISRPAQADVSDADYAPIDNRSPRPRPQPSSPSPARDNTSRFDD